LCQLECLVARRRQIKLKEAYVELHPDDAANALTNAAVDPVAKIPEYKVCAVKVEAVA
jgi:predicted molibdopterin-dependent oxidoreductase YjgC